MLNKVEIGIVILRYHSRSNNRACWRPRDDTEDTFDQRQTVSLSKEGDPRYAASLMLVLHDPELMQSVFGVVLLNTK